MSDKENETNRQLGELVDEWNARFAGKFDPDRMSESLRAQLGEIEAGEGE